MDGVGAIGSFGWVEGVPGVRRRDGAGEGKCEEGEKGGGEESGVHCWKCDGVVEIQGGWTVRLGVPVGDGRKVSMVERLVFIQ